MGRPQSARISRPQHVQGTLEGFLCCRLLRLLQSEHGILGFLTSAYRFSFPLKSCLYASRRCLRLLSHLRKCLSGALIFSMESVSRKVPSLSTLVQTSGYSRCNVSKRRKGCRYLLAYVSDFNDTPSVIFKIERLVSEHLAKYSPYQHFPLQLHVPTVSSLCRKPLPLMPAHGSRGVSFAPVSPSPPRCPSPARTSTFYI